MVRNPNDHCDSAAVFIVWRKDYVCSLLPKNGSESKRPLRLSRRIHCMEKGLRLQFTPKTWFGIQTTIATQPPYSLYGERITFAVYSQNMVRNPNDHCDSAAVFIVWRKDYVC